MENLTILIKTFMRPGVAQRLIDSIKCYYPNIKITMLDDKDDIGVSAGRNIMVDECETEYCMILDDDCIFTEKTDLKLALELVKDCDLLGIKIVEKNGVLNYKGRYEFKDGIVRLINEEPYEFIANIFIAKTNVLKKYRWDERLKVGEHFAYFFTHRGKLNIKHTDKIEIRHDHIDQDNYRVFRGRAEGYVKMFMKENGINKRIDLSGGVIVC